MGLLAKAIGLLVSYQAGITFKENVERHTYYNEARAYCDSVDKPLLVVGMQRFFWEPPNGDITVDIDPKVETIPGGVWASEMDIPFPNKTFGACYNAHTLEHLASAEEVELAVNECCRVADKVVFLAPSPYSIYSSLFCPAHNLRLWFDQVNNQIRVAKNDFRTGFGFQPGAGDTTHPPPLGQALVIQDTAPAIVKVGRGFSVNFQV